MTGQRHDSTLTFGAYGGLGVVVVQEENAAMGLEFTLDCPDLDQMAEFWQAAVRLVTTEY